MTVARGLSARPIDVLGLFEPRPRFGGPPVHQRDMPRNRERPRFERGIGPVGMTRSVQLKKRVLQQLLREGPIAAERDEIPQEPRCEQPVQLVERHRRAELIAQHQRPQPPVFLHSEFTPPPPPPPSATTGPPRRAPRCERSPRGTSRSHTSRTSTPNPP